MSPVSRGRKPKKRAKRTKNGPSDPTTANRQFGAHPDSPGAALAVLQRQLGSTERPPWFSESITRVLNDADMLTSERGPRELDQLTAELVGAELHRALHEERDGLWFGWWFGEIADAARDRVEQAAGGGSWEPPFWLLHGLAAIAPPSLAPTMPRRATVKALGVAAAPPRWLADVPRITGTGEVFRMCDAYGTRFGVIAGFTYPHARDRSVFLFDIDAAGIVILADAGVFDDVEQAAAAWRSNVGDVADHAHPEPVGDADELLCLVHLEAGAEVILRGDEPRPVMDNWFRVQRRTHELGQALRKRRMPLPAATPLYRELDTTVMTQPFTAWFTDIHSVEPHPEAVEALALEWMEGTLPETWFAVSPRRVEFQLALIGDWIEDEITTETRALMPEWVRWLGERTGLPENLRERTLAVAGGR